MFSNSFDLLKYLESLSMKVKLKNFQEIDITELISKLKKSISEFQTINHKFIYYLDSFSREFEEYGYEDIDIESIFAVPLRHIQDSTNCFIVESTNSRGRSNSFVLK